MKKMFKLTAPNKKPERQADSVKYEVKKYIKRERRKTIPEGFNHWEFDCKIGNNQDEASTIKTNEINSTIDSFVESGKEEIYIEVLSRATQRPAKK